MSASDLLGPPIIGVGAAVGAWLGVRFHEWQQARRD